MEPITKEQFAQIVQNLGGQKKAEEILKIAQPQISAYISGTVKIGNSLMMKLISNGLIYNNVEDATLKQIKEDDSNNYVTRIEHELLKSDLEALQKKMDTIIEKVLFKR